MRDPFVGMYEKRTVPYAHCPKNICNDNNNIADAVSYTKIG